MLKILKIFLIICFVGGIAALLIWFFKTQDVAVVNPKGIIALEQKRLLISATWLMLIVVVPVLIMTGVFAWKYRESNPLATYTPNWASSHVAEIFWWTIPCVIVVFLAIITWFSSHKLDPYRPIQAAKPPLTIQAVALNWKWLFIYPEHNIATINFVQFPENTPIHFEITADAPMNSFWIPELGGQIYAMPAMTTQLHLMATETGTFRGCSSNISGEGFAGMVFTAEASSDEAFDQWVEKVHNEGQPLTLTTYNALVEPSSYVPVSVYNLKEKDLFHEIIMKYTMQME